MVLSTILANGQNPDFLKIIEYGIKAPSGHNTQPWKFRLNETSIDVYPNFSKELPVIDLNHRELYISLGCAVENICIASNEFGYSYQTEIIKQDSFSFIRIELQKSDVDKNPLFDQIDKRQTNRSVYKSKSIQTNAIDELKKLNIKKTVSIYFYPKGGVIFQSFANLFTGVMKCFLQTRILKSNFLIGCVSIQDTHKKKEMA